MKPMISPSPSRLMFLMVSAIHGSLSPAQVFTYEADLMPEDAGWQINQIYCDPELTISDGRFVAVVDHCDPNPPGNGQQVAYRRNLDEFIGTPTYFVEWRLESDFPGSELIFGVPTGLAVSGLDEVRYTFVVASDLVRLNRDNFIPEVWVPISAGEPHIHRLELFGDDFYVYYIDAAIADSGVPEGPFPSYDPFLVWVTRARNSPSTNTYDYVRYGSISDPGSGDFDSDNDLDGRDWYYFRECMCGCSDAESLDLRHPGAPTHCDCPDTDAGPSCRWADMDQDGDVDFADFAVFQRSFTGSGE